MKLPQLKMPKLRPNKEYYFIVANVQGKPYVDGGYNSQSEAEQMAWKTLRGVVYVIVPAKTKQEALFTQQMKHQMLEHTEDINEAIKPVKHTL